jgi:glycosyltransferase involved in cell wall biosynthesis
MGKRKRTVMDNPKVSLILSVYNEEEVLEECLDSLLKQTYDNLEIICIDDGSEDNSRDILERYDSENKQINFVPNEENLGLTKSLNKGIDIAEGKYIARQDADDFSLEKRIEKQVEYMENHPEVFLTGQHSDTTRYYDEHGNLLRDFRPGKKKGLDLEERVPIDHSSIMFRNDGMKYREKFQYSQDYDLYLRIKTDKGEIKLLDEELIYRKIQLDSISSRNNKKQAYFRDKGREFYQQRKQQAEDQYNQWQPGPPEQETTEESRKEMYYRKKMEYCLESKNKRKAQEFFGQYLILDEINNIDKLKWFVATRFWYIFWLYRKILV